MSGSVAPKAPWLSRFAVGAGLALALLALAGGALHALAPSAPDAAELARLAAELLVAAPSDLKPEPAEHFVYAGLIALTPLVFGAAAWAAVRWRQPGAGRLDWPLAAVALAAVWLIVGADPVGVRFRVAPWLFGLLVVLAGALAAGDRVAERRRGAPALAAALAALLAAGLIALDDRRDVASLHAPRLHFEAFSYALLASAHGRTCLVNLHAQYGCYGMVLGPALRLVGTSVSHITLAATALSIVTVGAIAVFAGRTLRSPLLAVGAVLALPVLTLRPGGDIYLQYLPLRVLFPALSLPAILWWDAKSTAGRAALLGAAAACAVFWNLDSGAPTAGAVGLYIVAAGARPIRRRLELGLSYAGALTAACGLLIALLTLKGGAWPDLWAVLDYQRIFVGSGFYMLPMPAPPAAWTACVGVAAVALAWFAVRMAEGAPSPRADRAAFLAVLAVGLFSYYVGRSHVEVLATAAWLFVILAFLLMDAYRPSGRAAGAAWRWAGALAVVMLASLAVRLAPLLPPQRLSGADATAQDIAFVRSRTAPGAPLALLASKQAVILAELDRAPALPGPGWAETLTRKDADALFAYLVARGPHDVFVSDDLIWNTRALSNLSPWIPLRLPLLNPVYEVVERGPGGRLLHFVRRPGAPSIPMAGGVRSR